MLQSNSMLQPLCAAVATPDVEIDKDQDVKHDDLWKIIIHNDNVTSIDFVRYVLVRIFEKPLIFADAITMEAHNNGNAVVDALPKTEAQTRINKAQFAARLEGYPLKFTLEPA